MRLGYLAEPTEAELKKQAAFRGKARAAAVIKVTFGGSTLLSHRLTKKLCGGGGGGGFDGTIEI